MSERIEETGFSYKLFQALANQHQRREELGWPWLVGLAFLPGWPRPRANKPPTCPSDDVLESLYNLRILQSEQIKTVLELYEMEIHKKILMCWKDYVDGCVHMCLFLKRT